MEYTEEEKKAFETLEYFEPDDLVECSIYLKSIKTIKKLIEKQQKEIENSISKNLIKELIDFAINATNLKDDYSIGMCNGMIYLKSVILNEIPIYKECKHE